MSLRYDTILFDIDDTLLDFKKAEKSALKKVFLDHSYPFNDDIERRYNEINKSLWRDFEKGIIEKNIITKTRFQKLFDEIGITADGENFNTLYLAALSEGHDLMNGAIEICEALSKFCRLYFVTNGISKTQHKRIDASGLRPYFLDTFVSEDTGYQKPMKEYFDYVFDRIPDLNLERTLIVGDSLSSDIKGGIQSCIDNCWYNPNSLENTYDDINPTYEIKELNELFSIIKG